MYRFGNGIDGELPDEERDCDIFTSSLRPYHSISIHQAKINRINIWDNKTDLKQLN